MSNPRTSALFDQVEAIIKTLGISQSEAARQIGETPQTLTVWMGRRSLMFEAGAKIQEWVQRHLQSIMRKPAHRRLYESHLEIIKQEQKKKYDY